MYKYNINVLYVEDDNITEQIFSEILSKKVEKFSIASSGEDGLKMFIKNKYDIVITDINLPNITGIELAQKIKSLDNEIEIIAISSINDLERIMEAINSGINYFLIKPVKINEFYSVLQKAYKRIVDRKELEEYRENLETLVQARTIKLRESNDMLLEEIKNREKIEEQAMILYRAIEQSPSITILTDIYGKIEYVNKKFEKIINKRREEIIENYWVDILNLGEKKELYNLVKEKKLWESEIESIINSKKICLSISFAPVYSLQNECSHFVISIEDITERKEMEKEIINAKNKAEAVNKAKSRFLANMSHEIRTPMNGVIMMSDIILNSELNEKQKKIAELLKKSAKSLVRLINDILDFSRMEAGKLILEESNFFINEVVEDILEMFEIIARNKNLDFKSKISEYVPKEMIGDAKRLKQILINLVGNAVKFTEKGYIELKIEREEEDSEKVKLKFIIKDTGIGIPHDKHETIFEDFEQGDSSYTKQYEGAGLGLSISKNIVKLMNGEIGVKSEESFGSEFYFTVWMYKVKETPDIKYDYGFDFLREKLKNKRLNVLVAEDNHVNQIAIESLLKTAYCDVDIAHDGRQVIDMWQKGNYDIILMDIQMPHINGMDATIKIREIEKQINKKNIPIIAVSAYAMKNDIKKILKAGVDDYIVKPIKMESLYAKMIEILKL